MREWDAVWDEEWDGPVEVEVDTVISAEPKEESAGYTTSGGQTVRLVRTVFAPTAQGHTVIESIRDSTSPTPIIVGSIIAAQAYPREVFSMVPCEGYERVPPNEKRMKPDTFNVF